jgi:uncharacterized protein (TIGR02757 family)
LEYLELKDFLDLKVRQYNRPDFITNDPVCIPHQFSKKQDIEIAAFFAAILAWGQRKTIINKCRELFNRMDNQPYDFILNHQEADLKRLLGFKHRTFNDTDLLYFVEFFKQHYLSSDTLETAFMPIVSQKKLTVDSVNESLNDETQSESGVESRSEDFEIDLKIKRPSSKSRKDDLIIESKIKKATVESGNEKPIVASKNDISIIGSKIEEPIELTLNYFRSYFFSLPDFPGRTIKHVSSPKQKSTCKRLNMFLRWMVRKDNCGVDFGLWNQLKPSELICPCDVHVDRVARILNMITRKQTDWTTAVELTIALRTFDPIDPVKYDFALFGLGVEEKF